MEFLTSIGLPWFTIAVAALGSVFLYFYGTRHARKLKATFGDLPPGPKPVPFIGNLADTLKYGGQTHLLFDDYYKKYGKLFPLSSFGTTSLMVADSEMIRQILVKDFDAFYDRTVFIELNDPLDKMLSVAKGDTWKRIRNTLSPTFSAHKMKMMVPLMNEACDILLKKLAEMADTGKSVDIVGWQQCLTLDIIFSAAFGIRSNCQLNPDDPVMTKARTAMRTGVVQRTIIALSAILPFGNNLLKLLSGWLFVGMEDMGKVAKEMIDMKRKDSSSKRMDMLELMLNAEDPDTHNKKLSDSEIAAQCIVFLLAGYETTSTTLGLTCYHLASNPEVQEKLQREIDEVWTKEDQMPSYETVRDLSYLDMVLSETLRLYPPGFMLNRHCMKNSVIKDVKIPEGTAIFIPVYSIHRDPEFWPNPSKFDTERFSPEAKQSRDPYTYMPFGHGPHNCVGMRFVQMEMKLVLARILKRFSFELAPDAIYPPYMEVQATLTVPKGVTLRVVSRKPADTEHS